MKRQSIRRNHWHAETVDMKIEMRRVKKPQFNMRQQRKNFQCERRDEKYY